ncbi:hypothetical protein BJV78DRAFT_309802 [Lactifluus subvellereus]|nr:hypothetical protein BJV78DRAFT_309802 [Lactifluus subvellereus]
MPWPNPLTNGVELSIRSLNLIFHLHPRVAEDVPLSPTNLADSISDAAQLFAHEEITREESTEVYQAFQSSRTPRSNKGDDYVPGGLDASREDHEVHPDVDPTGISMFASMFEYLLSQFTFSAKDISIAVVHPGHSSFRFKFSEFQYGKPTAGHGESTRTIKISGVEIAHRDLGTLGSLCSHSESGSLNSSRREFNAASYQVDNMVLSSTAASPSLPTPSSKGRSGSNDPMPSVDSWVPEHRSRPSSPSGSTTSSLFQSALTTQGSGRECQSFEAMVAYSHDVVGGDTEPDPSSRTAGDCPLSPADGATKDELFHRVIVSLATEPIVVHITTSTPPVPPKALAQTPPTSHTTEPDTSRPDPLQPNLGVSVSVGVVACALTAAQISAILDIISVIGSHSGQNGQPSVSKNVGLVAPPLSFLDQASLMLQIRGIVLLLQSVPASLTASFEDAHDVPLNDFFSHPLTPPKANYGYIRFIMDTLKADFSVSTTLEQLVDEPSPILDQLRERRRVSRGVRGTTSSQLRFSIGDLSACAFCMPNNVMAAHAAHDSFVLPILLTDPLLFTQYSPEHHPPLPSNSTRIFPQNSFAKRSLLCLSLKS